MDELVPFPGLRHVAAGEVSQSHGVGACKADVGRAGSDPHYRQKTTNKTWVKGLVLFFWLRLFNCKMWAGPGPLKHLVTPAANERGLSCCSLNPPALSVIQHLRHFPASDSLPDTLQRGSLARSFSAGEKWNHQPQ